MIYLMRHAEAVSDEVDPVRPLSARGREQVARVCRTLSQIPHFHPVEIWHSPLVRSVETADLLARGLNLNSKILLKVGLKPNDDPGPLAAELAAETRDIAIVGHEPHLGILASMITHDPRRKNGFFPFSKAGLLALSKGPDSWQSEWIVRSP